MKMSVISNKQVSFGSVNLVQISKKAFSSTENLLAIEDVFLKHLNSTSGEMPNLFSKLIGKVFKRKEATKALFFLESPSFSAVDEFCKSKNIPNQYWLGKRFGINAQEPIDSRFHSFYVFTKKDKDNLWDLTAGVKNNEIAERTRAIVSDRRKFLFEGKEYVDFTDGGDFFDIEERIVADSLVMPQLPPVTRVFKLNGLSELPAALAQIDY